MSTAPTKAPTGGVAFERPRLNARLVTALAVVAGLGLVAWSIYVRTRAFNMAYWIDEGLSIGIARHAFVDIPGVLRQDGSPPLYYMLLHFWTSIFGTDEPATHAFSLVISTLTIPAGLWAGWSLFDRRAGITTAILCAGNPFLTAYAQETRMYSLVVLWSLLCTACFLHVFVYRRRKYIPWFALTLAALLYTHMWSAFFVLGAGVSALWIVLLRRDDRSALLRDALLGFGGAFLLYLPWLPTALYQVKHTGAPWSQGPTWRAAQQIPHTLAGGWREIWITAIVAAVGIFVAWRARRREDRAAWIVLGLLATMVVLAWTISNASHVWVPRYFAIFVGPFLIAVGWAFARAGVIGIAGLVILGAGFQFYPHTPEKLTLKSNVRFVAEVGARRLHRGDVVLSTHPEQIPLIHYYLNAEGAHGMRYATELGWVPDVQVWDWRDGVKRLRATRAKYDLAPILDGMRVGQQLYLIRPVVSRKNEWTAPWTSLVKRRSLQWTHATERDRRFKLERIFNNFLQVGHRNGAVQGRLYVKTHR
ncbi:MAG: glycosyltransferase family 39 protein [Thermoleophilaceae bacterium]|jgi:mannosyltransferase